MTKSLTNPARRDASQCVGLVVPPEQRDPTGLGRIGNHLAKDRYLSL